MSVPVPLGELAAALARRGNWVYLLTVGDDQRAHCVASPLAWAGGEIEVQAGTTSRRNATARGNAVLLSPPCLSPARFSPPVSPPEDAGGDHLDAYSLIVDAEVPGTDGGSPAGTLRVRPTHAVLHRPAPALPGGPGHDCVHLYERPAMSDPRSDPPSGMTALGHDRPQGSAGSEGGRLPRSRWT
ncbi:MAG: hypothetical protein M0Z46_23520 [Actinomycetota bacterium]|nr:hypothetical protein [Actinomycetota bacterium]